MIIKAGDIDCKFLEAEKITFKNGEDYILFKVLIDNNSVIKIYKKSSMVTASFLDSLKPFDNISNLLGIVFYNNTLKFDLLNTK